VNALGWLGALLVVVSMLLRDPRWFRATNLAGALVLMTANAALGIASMVGLNAVIAVVDAYHLLRAPSTSRSTEHAIGGPAKLPVGAEERHALPRTG
jgi:hypothetical protein